MKRLYFKNILLSDIDYECDMDNNMDTSREYYNLSKLFLNMEKYSNIIIRKRSINKIIDSVDKTHEYHLKSIVL